MRQVIISDFARDKIKHVLAYIENKWSADTRQKFAQKLYYCIKVIQENPEAFPRSEGNKRIHKCVITKQTTIFYKFNIRKIEIIAVSDTRQDPNKIKKDIK